MFEVTPQTNDWPVMGKLIDFDEMATVMKARTYRTTGTSQSVV